MKKNLNPTKITQIATLALLLIFIVDLFAPLEIAIGILYILCFFLICTQSKKTVLSFFALTLILAVTKFIVFYNPDTSFIIYTNRLLTLTTISIITVLSIRYRKLSDSIVSDRINYEKQLEEMLFMTSHKVRKPLANCFGLLNLFEADKTLTQVEQNYIISHLKSSASELDIFTKELTMFMGDMKNKRP